MNKEQLEAELDRALKEIIRLSSENKKLLKLASNVNEDSARANELAKKYQKLFNELFKIIQIEYDAEFKIEDIPRYLS